MAGDWKVSIFYTPPGEPDDRFGDPASGLQFDYLVERLRQLRGPDGGFPTSPGGVSEVESTVVASLALSDATSRQWLTDHLRGDGGVVLADGRVDGPTSSALIALALSNRGSAKRAKDVRRPPSAPVSDAAPLSGLRR